MVETAPCEVLLVGCDHLVDWDGEAGRPDILSPGRQLELDDLIGRLGTFSPTKVGVEALRSRQAQIDRSFASYRRGGGREDRSELTQIGFRLAEATGATVHAIDADWSLDWAALEDYFERHPGERPQDGLSESGLETIRAWEGLRQRLALADHLVEINSEPGARLNDREYLDRWSTLGADDNWGGVNLVASWYRRNLRIYANLRTVTAPGDRVVVVFGLGHVCSLRHFFETSSVFDVIDLGHVLASA